jgi:hypothetical protein
VNGATGRDHTGAASEGSAVQRRTGQQGKRKSEAGGAGVIFPGPTFFRAALERRRGRRSSGPAVTDEPGRSETKPTKRSVTYQTGGRSPVNGAPTGVERERVGLVFCELSGRGAGKRNKGRSGVNGAGSVVKVTERRKWRAGQAEGRSRPGGGRAALRSVPCLASFSAALERWRRGDRPRGHDRPGATGAGGEITELPAGERSADWREAAEKSTWFLVVSSRESV